MNEISFAAPEVAASRQRGTPADEGKLWETLRLDAERAAAGEEMLRGQLCRQSGSPPQMRGGTP